MRRFDVDSSSGVCSDRRVRRELLPVFRGDGLLLSRPKGRIPHLVRSGELRHAYRWSKHGCSRSGRRLAAPPAVLVRIATPLLCRHVRPMAGHADRRRRGAGQFPRVFEASRPGTQTQRCITLYPRPIALQCSLAREPKFPDGARLPPAPVSRGDPKVCRTVRAPPDLREDFDSLDACRDRTYDGLDLFQLELPQTQGTRLKWGQEPEKAYWHGPQGHDTG